MSVTKGSDIGKLNILVPVQQPANTPNGKSFNNHRAEVIQDLHNHLLMGDQADRRP